MKKKTREYDAIIIGTGIAGLGAAYALVRRGKKILLITTKQPLKGESTPASAGILDPFLESASPENAFFEFKKKAFLKLPGQIKSIEREAGMKTGYCRTGMLFAAFNVLEEKKLKARLVSHRPSGIPVRWFDKTQSLRTWPALGRGVRGALFYPTLGRVFPDKLQKAIYRIVIRRGARVLRAQTKIRLLIENGRVSGVVLNGKKIASRSIINAGGSWADAMGFSTLRFPIFPVRGQVLIVRGKTKKTIPVVHSAGGIYIVPWQKGTYLLGSTVEKAGFNAAVQSSVLRKIHRQAAGMIPEMWGFKPLRSWAGLRPCSQDHLPLLGKTGIKGYYMAAGYYRSGIVVSLHAGELLAQGLFGKRFSKELVPFSPLRFAKK